MGFEKERGVLAIETEPGVSFIRVALAAGASHEVPALRALRPLSERGIGVRLVRIHPNSLTFVVGESDQAPTSAGLSKAGVDFDACPDCAVVTVLAPDMRSVTGLLARVGETLHARGIEVYQTADSHSSVACVIPCVRAAEAVEALRSEFGLPGEAEGTPR
ncbi:MAG: ACT domain-containing protein [Armatimonadetes bacterium]|nr:ACT domain-containing protein [Armatimonadota bacterium]